MPPRSFDPLQRMQRGIIFLISAALFRFVFLSSTSRESDSKSDDEIGIPGTLLTSRNIGLSNAFAPIDSTVVNPAIDVGDRVGLLNPYGNLCYMNAVFSCMFNIHRLRESLYACEPEKASHVLLGELFARIQTSTTPVSSTSTIVPALTEDIKWTFGGHQCNLEFGEAILGFLPQSVKDLYQIKVRHDAFMRSNGEFMSSQMVDECHYVIPLAFPSISAAILSDFPDNHPENTFFVYQSEYENFRHLIQPFEGLKLDVPVFRKSVIMNRPEILVFGIRRQKFTESGDNLFDGTKMDLDLEITLSGVGEGSEPVVYLLHAFCYHEPAHHLSYVRDFSTNRDGDWFKYNDSNVTPVRTVGDYEKLQEKASTAATMAFYVRADSVMTPENKREIPVPDRIMTLTKLMSTLDKIREATEPVSSIFDLRHHSTSLPIDSGNFLRPSAHFISPPKTTDKKKRNNLLPALTSTAFEDAFPADAAAFFFTNTEVSCEEA